MSSRQVEHVVLLTGRHRHCAFLSLIWKFWKGILWCIFSPPVMPTCSFGVCPARHNLHLAFSLSSSIFDHRHPLEAVYHRGKLPKHHFLKESSMPALMLALYTESKICVFSFAASRHNTWRAAGFLVSFSRFRLQAKKFNRSTCRVCLVASA